MTLPRNANSIAIGRNHGMRPRDPVIVSFAGDTGWPNPHVYADSGAVYDWTFLTALHVFIVVKPGIECQRAIRDIFAVAALYPTLVDIESQTAASVIDDHPLRLWNMSRGFKHWKEIFCDDHLR